MGKQWKQWQILFSWAPKSLWMVTAAMKLKQNKNHLLFRRKAVTNLASVLRSRGITLPTKVHLVKVMVFSSSHLSMWELDHKEGWARKNWCSAGEDYWETFGQQGDQANQSERKSTLNIHWKGWCWSSNTLFTWCEEPTHWKRPWCWERLKAGG